jgi:hypothetical protein
LCSPYVSRSLDLLSVQVAGMVAVAKYLTLLVIVYTALRLITLYFAPKEIFFSGVKPGRIKRINNNGKLVKFIAHLKGLTGILDDPSQPDGLHIGACHIDEATGQILPGEEVINSIWWTLFGVRPLGFNSISDYKLKKKKIVEVEVEEAGVDGKKKKVKKNVVVEEEFTASSLFFSESYPRLYA